MGKTDIIEGHAKFEDFMYWITERNAIYERRKAGKPWPWSEDVIFQQYRFTNAFRELDHGTQVLRKAVRPIVDTCQGNPENDATAFLLWTIVWYRYHNYYENITRWSQLPRNPDQLHERLLTCYHGDKQIFTGCHMVSGQPGTPKIETYQKAIQEVWEHRFLIVYSIREGKTLENAFNVMKEYFFCGPFVAYEIVSDLRWTPLLRYAPDKLTWANLGPGCKRGLQRLGMELELESLRTLYEKAGSYFIATEATDYFEELYGRWGRAVGSGRFGNEDDECSIWLDGTYYPPFELREIEHSLCEFDKYQRVKTGVGRPRQKYHLEDRKD